MNRCGSFPLLSAPRSLSLFSVWTNLKRSEKIPGAPTRRWGEWIWLTGPSGLHRNSPQGLNISFIMGFWPDQRSGNSNHPSPPVSEILILMSTAVEQAVWCAPVTKRARVRSPVAKSYLGDCFSGVPSPARQMSGSFSPTRSQNIIWLSSSFHIRLVGMNGCVNDVCVCVCVCLCVYHLSCSCCLGGGPGIELIPHSGRLFMSLCGQKGIYVIQNQFPLPTGRGSVRPGRRESLKGTYNGEIKLR